MISFNIILMDIYTYTTNKSVGVEISIYIKRSDYQNFTIMRIRRKTMKKQVFSAIRFGILLGFIIILSACGASPTRNDSASATALTSTSPVASASASSGTVESPKQSTAVSIKDFKFAPETIEINKGETVTWKNEDSATHTVAFDAFQSGTMKQGDTFEHIFDTVGTFSYYCGNHPNMIGTVKVK